MHDSKINIPQSCSLTTFHLNVFYLNFFWLPHQVPLPGYLISLTIVMMDIQESPSSDGCEKDWLDVGGVKWVVTLLTFFLIFLGQGCGALCIKPILLAALCSDCVIWYQTAAKSGFTPLHSPSTSTLMSLSLTKASTCCTEPFLQRAVRHEFSLE